MPIRFRNKLTLNLLISTGIRWALAILLVVLAIGYPTEWYLYLVALLVFATGFLRPRRCNVDCNNN